VRENDKVVEKEEEEKKGVERRKLTHHQQSHQQPKAPDPTLPKHSSSQPDLSIIMIQHHGKLSMFEIT